MELVYEVYKNLQEYAKYGQLEKFDLLNIEDFKTEINKSNTVLIKTKDLVRNHEVLIVLVNVNDKTSDFKSIEYKKIFKLMKLDGKEIIIITENEMKSTLIKNITSELVDGGALSVNMYTYIQFYIVWPKGPNVPKHILLNNDGVNKLMDENFISNKKQMPWISERDIQAIWIRARKGDVVNIERESETGGYAMYPRYVIM